MRSYNRFVTPMKTGLPFRFCFSVFHIFISLAVLLFAMSEMGRFAAFSWKKTGFLFWLKAFCSWNNKGDFEIIKRESPFSVFSRKIRCGKIWKSQKVVCSEKNSFEPCTNDFQRVVGCKKELSLAHFFARKWSRKAVGLLVRDRLQATAKLQKSFNAGNYFPEKKTAKLPPPISQ